MSVFHTRAEEMMEARAAATRMGKIALSRHFLHTWQESAYQSQQERFQDWGYEVSSCEMSKWKAVPCSHKHDKNFALQA